MEQDIGTLYGVSSQSCHAEQREESFDRLRTGLSERPFVELTLSDKESCFVSLSMTMSEGLRVTILVCQSFVV